MKGSERIRCAGFEKAGHTEQAQELVTAKGGCEILAQVGDEFHPMLGDVWAACSVILNICSCFNVAGARSPTGK